MLHRGLILAALALLLSGCASNGGAPVGEPGAPAATSSEQILLGRGAVEASVAIGSGGQVLVVSNGALQEPSPVWFSADGDEFVPVPANNGLPSSDSDVAIGKRGELYVVHDNGDTASVHVSTNAGKTWRSAHVVAVPLGVVDRPWLLLSGEEVYVFYSTLMITAPSVVMMSKSTDGGATWLDHRVVATAAPPASTHRILGKPVVLPESGRILVPLLAWNPAIPGAHLELASSDNGGASWSVEPVGGTFRSALGWPVLAGDERRLFFAYAPGLSRDSAVSDVAVLTSTDGGAKWAGPFVVAENVKFTPRVYPFWADARPDGSALVVWQHQVGTGPNWGVGAAVVSTGGVVQPRGEVVEPFARGETPEFLMVDHAADGEALIAYAASGSACGADSPPVLPDCIFVVSLRPD